jgi:hypothetical protein
MMPRRKTVRRVEGATAADSMNAGSEHVPLEFQQLYLELVSLTDGFCSERLNGEYQELCREVAALLCQSGTPAIRGKPASWACGIVSAVGRVNFLTDPNQDPHVRSEEIAAWFGVSAATMQSKAKIIREGLDLVPLDPDYTLPSRQAENPLVWMFDVNGLILDIRQAPRAIQQAAFEAGAIPYVPADREGDEATYVVAHERVSPPAKNQKSKAKGKSKQAGYQIKITLDGSKPPIWRRLRVPDCTLEALHEILQTAMGWQNCHMHEFRAGDERFVMANMEEFHDRDDDAREESEATLRELIEAGHKKLHYWYDFGDDWHHTIVMEKVVELQPGDASPVCLAGAGACPPEDFGGLWGYAEFLEAMADPQHERHEELTEWYGKEFDARRFDMDEVNQWLGR